MYIIVNEDIRMSKAKLSAQVGHAVGAFYWQAMKEDVASQLMRARLALWHDSRVVKIILKAPESKIKEILEDDYYTMPIYDAGLTQIPANSLTCVGLGVLNSEDEKTFEKRPYLKSLKLA